MKRRTWRLSKRSAFGLLMIASAVLVLLPSSWTAWTGAALQPLSWVEAYLSRGTAAGVGVVQDRSHPVISPEDYDVVVRENEELQRLVAQQRLSLDQIAEVVEDLTGLRGQLRDSGAKILLARRIGGDSDPGRETLTISVGSLAGVRVGDWVAVGRPREDYGDEVGGRERAQRQSLIGKVSEVQPYRSRVQLCADAEFGPERVIAARRLDDGTLSPSNEPCLLYGKGGGRMQIQQAPENFLASGHSVVVAPLGGTVPLTLMLGEIVSAQPRPETALHYDFEVKPVAVARTVMHFYVLSFD